jgi:hypothetical protein
MEMQPKVTAYALPGMLAEIARLTTVEIAIVIARVHGGRRLYLPREPKRDHPLSKLIGSKAARLICAHWGGERHDVPSARTFLHWYDARRLRSQNLSHTKISRELGIGINHVARLLQGFEPSGPTLIEPQDEPAVCPVCRRRHRAVTTTERPDLRQLRLPIG